MRTAPFGDGDGPRLVYGIHPVREAMRAGTVFKKLWFERSPGPSAAELTMEASKRGIPFEQVARETLDDMVRDDRGTSSQGVSRHQGVVARLAPVSVVPLSELLASSGPCPHLLCMDQITDPQNFGAILRSAVALGVDGLVVPKRRSAPLGGTVSRTSAGAIEHARIAEVGNLAQSIVQLRDQGIECFGLSADGELELSSLHSPPPEGRALVIGAEGRGLRRLVRERCTHTIRIDMNSPLDSLNASVAASIALYVTTALRGKQS